MTQIVHYQSKARRWVARLAAATAIVGLVAIGSVATTTTPAEAGWHHGWGWHGGWHGGWGRGGWGWRGGWAHPGWGWGHPGWGWRAGWGWWGWRGPGFGVVIR